MRPTSRVPASSAAIYHHRQYRAHRDHAINICGYSKLLEERHIQFSAQAQEEICQMRDICLEALNALHQREAGDLLWLTDVSALEQRIDDMTDLFRKDQLEPDEGRDLF